MKSLGGDKVYAFSVDYRKDSRQVRGQLVNRGFWLHCPRPLVSCRVLGHKPVYDGYDPIRPGLSGARWVICDRCGTRPEPQSPRGGYVPNLAVLGSAVDPADMPGPWPRFPQGELGGQLIVGRGASCGIGFEVGCAGGEHDVAAHAAVPLLGGLYLHGDGFGRWLQRRLVPEGYEARVTDLHVSHGRLWWRLWRLQDSGKTRSVRLDPRDIIWGERRYWHEPAARMPYEANMFPVRIPGDSTFYAVKMTLKRQYRGRAKRESRRKPSAWMVDCACRDGLPTKTGGRGNWQGWAVEVSAASANDGTWMREAAAATIMKITKARTSEGWRPARQEDKI